jgi:NCAIR mutase (PurE)-related proteins
MDHNQLLSLLNDLHNQSIPVEQAFSKLKDLPFQDLGYAKIDHHRALRKGFPEVIFCQNKTSQQVVDIARAQMDHGETVFGTRANHEIIEAVNKSIPDVSVDLQARCFWKKSESWRVSDRARGEIVICSAGTSDLPVSLEALRTIEIFGHTGSMLTDVGVAGIHRLFSHKEKLTKASVIIAVAGMEGALPSVIAGYVSCPVIGVPTSVGYGSHLNGMVPLFAMLNSCASGLTVVNIDNGFGAACASVAINSLEG